MFKKLVEEFRTAVGMPHPEQPHQDHLPGGAADQADPDDFDQKELHLGIAHEMEHTHDPDIAMEIAMDHLMENPHYYTDLIDSGIEDGHEQASNQDPRTSAPQDER